MSSDFRALTERLEFQNVQFQNEFRQQLMMEFQQHIKTMMAELVHHKRLTMRAQTKNTMMEQQLMKSSSSSSSSGSSSGCMSFLQSCLGRAPAVVPAGVPAVLCYEEPASPMPLEIEAAANTAAPPLDFQEPAANTATPPLELNLPEEPVTSDSALEIEAELQVKIQQLQLQIDNVRRARPELNSQTLTSC